MNIKTKTILPATAFILLTGALLLFAGCEKEKLKHVERWVCHPEEGYTITLDIYPGYAISHTTPTNFNTKYVYQFFDGDTLFHSNDRLFHSDFDDSGFGFSMESHSKDTLVMHFLGFLPASFEYVRDYLFITSKK